MVSSGQVFHQNEPKHSVVEAPYIGVIGGSGLDKLTGLDVLEVQTPKTVYGKPSAPVSIGMFGGAKVAFLPRHGEDHSIPPHKIPYKANLAALRAVGVRHVIGTCIVGGLRSEFEPGMFVVPDQFINMTWGRDDSFPTDKMFTHLGMADPYCEHCRNIVARELKAMNLRVKTEGVVVVIQGPRFSTKAESKMFAQWGGDIVNMTQYPECYFAKDLGLCYAAVASVTDYDVGVSSALSMHSETMNQVVEIFRRNTLQTLQLLERLVPLAAEFAACSCAAARIAEYYNR